MAVRQIHGNPCGSFANDRYLLSDGAPQQLGLLKRLKIGAADEFGRVIGGLDDIS
jgi:hypothetical protein